MFMHMCVARRLAVQWQAAAMDALGPTRFPAVRQMKEERRESRRAKQAWLTSRQWTKRQLGARLMEMGAFAAMDGQTLLETASVLVDGSFAEHVDLTFVFSAMPPWTRFCRRLAEIKDEIQVNDLANIIDHLRRANHYDASLLLTLIPEISMDVDHLSLSSVVKILDTYRHFNVALPSVLHSRLVTSGLTASKAVEAELAAVLKLLNLAVSPKLANRKKQVVSQVLGSLKPDSVGLEDLMELLKFAEKTEVQSTGLNLVKKVTKGKSVVALAKAARDFPTHEKFIEELVVAIQNDCVAKISVFAPDALSAPVRLQIPALHAAEESPVEAEFALEEEKQQDAFVYLRRRSTGGVSERVHKIDLRELGERNRVMQTEIMESVRTAAMLKNAKLLATVEPLVRDGVTGLTREQLRETLKIFETSEIATKIREELTRKTLKTVKVVGLDVC